MSVAAPRLGVRRRTKAATRARTEALSGDRTISLILAMVSGGLLFLIANLTLVSQLEHYTLQAQLYSQLRLSLAEGATPIGPTGVDGKLVTPGTPVAFMSFPSIGIQREVVVEGTTSGQTMQGVGHRRDSVMPCQAGSSVLMARSGAAGAIGARWARLQPGDTFAVTMGQGSCTYQVMDLRHAGQKPPAPPVNEQGRLVLTTADGSPFLPAGVLRIDAQVISDSYPRSSTALPAGSLPQSESAMGNDTTQLTGLLVYGEILVALAFAGTWMWRRWGRWQTWLTLVPPLTAFALLAANNLDLLLPNLL